MAIKAQILTNRQNAKKPPAKTHIKQKPMHKKMNKKRKKEVNKLTKK